MLIKNDRYLLILLLLCWKDICLCVCVCICFFGPTVSGYLKSSLREGSGINSLLLLHKLITIGPGDSHTLRLKKLFYFLFHLHPPAPHINRSKFHFSEIGTVLNHTNRQEQCCYCKEHSMLWFLGSFKPNDSVCILKTSFKDHLMIWKISFEASSLFSGWWMDCSIWKMLSTENMLENPQTGIMERECVCGINAKVSRKHGTNNK